MVLTPGNQEGGRVVVAVVYSYPCLGFKNVPRSHVPRSSSSNASWSSCWVFMTMGPYQATGSSSGLLETRRVEGTLLGSSTQSLSLLSAVPPRLGSNVITFSFAIWDRLEASK